MKKYLTVLVLVLLMGSAFATAVHADTAKATKKEQKKEDRQSNPATTTIDTTISTSTPPVATVTPTTTPSASTMLPFSKQTVLYVLYGVALVIAIALIAGLFGTMGILFIITLGGALAITTVLILIASFTSIF